MSKAPLVTVAVPTYNRSKLLSRAIASVRAQTYPEMEILIGDNASTDGTAAIAEAAARDDPRVQVLRHATNLGSAGNFQALLDAAKGKYFMWHADDDAAHPRFIERIVAFLEANPDVVSCGTDYEFTDDHGNVIGTWDMGGIHPDRPWPESRKAFFLYPDGRYVMMVYAVHRTEVLRMVGVPRPLTFRRTMSGTETPFLAKLATKGRLVSLPERLFQYNEHPVSKDSLAHHASKGLKRWELALLYATVQSHLVGAALAAPLPISDRVRLAGTTIGAVARRLTGRPVT